VNSVVLLHPSFISTENLIKILPIKGTKFTQTIGQTTTEGPLFFSRPITEFEGSLVTGVLLKQ
jgi:hypothetical protein